MSNVHDDFLTNSFLTTLTRIRWRCYSHRTPPRLDSPGLIENPLLQTHRWWLDRRIPSVCVRQGTDRQNVEIAELWVFDIRDGELPAMPQPLQTALTVSEDGVLNVDSGSPLSSTKPGRLFLEAVMNLLERIFAPVGIIRVRSTFLLTPYFMRLGRLPLMAFNPFHANDQLLPSVEVNLSSVGPNLVLQLKLSKSSFRSLLASDFSPGMELDVTLSPAGLKGRFVASAQPAKQKRCPEATRWSSLYGYPESMLQPPLNSPQIPSVIKVSVGDGRFVTEYPTVLASVQCEHFPAKLLDQYRSDFLKWMWTDDLVSLVGSWSSGNGQAPLLMGLDISGCFDASRRSIELSLVDGGATEVLLESRKKEAEEKARKEAEEAKRLQEIATAQAAVSLLPEEPAPLPSAVPETKQSFSNYSMMLPSDDPFSDLSLNMGDGSDMVDLDLAVIDDSDFDVFVGTGSGTTPVTNGFSAVSPALPAGTSPSPFTFPATPAQQPFATVSPAPFTPAPYATPSHIASNGMSPPPATPCPPTSSIGDDTLLFQSNCSVPSKPENDPTPAAISVTRPPFEVKIFEESGEPLAANSLMPERWRSILIDYNLVWESKASSDRRKYGPGGQFSYSPNLGLKRTLGERARERKRPRYNDGPAVGEKVEESSESEDETSLSEASDISTDTGRQVAGAQAFAPIFISPLSIGAASSMSEDLMGRADSSSLLPFLVIPKDSGVESQEDPSLSTPQNEVAFELDELVISLLVDGYALGREHRWLHFNHRSSETPSLDYHPLFQYAVLCRLSSLFSHIFSTKSVNGNTQERDSGLGIKNMLNVQQFFDAHEVDKSMSKYGRFQIRKKRRPTEQILEPLEAPSIILYHDSHLVSLSTASIRFWDKLRIAPRGGMKDIDFMMLCPHNPDIADSLRYWCSEFRTVWDAGNFGQCTPYISLKPGDDGLFYMSAEGAAGGEDNRLVSKYKEALAILARHLSQSMVETTQSNSKQSSHVIFIPNCFPHRPQSHLEMTTLSAEFLRSIAEMSHCELDDVLSRVVPVVLPLDLLLSFSACRELGKAFQMRDFCFGIYARCRKPTPAGTGGGRLFTPTYTLSYEASSNPTQLLSVKRPVDYAMSSILEPDRVIHLAYFVRWTNGRWWIGASWCDSFGEAVDCFVATQLNQLGLDGLFTRLWRRTLAFTGNGGLRWRVVVGRYGSITNEEVHLWEKVFFADSPQIGVLPPAAVLSVSLVNFSGDTYMSFMDLRGWLSGSTRANVSATVAGPQTPGPSTPGLPSTPAAGCNSPPDEDLASPNHSFATGFAESHYHDDAPTSYCYVLANHRSPLRLTPSPSSARSTFPASLPCTILPLATGWLIDVPRRDSAGTSGFVSSPPSEFTPVNAATPIATSASSTSSAGVASLATPASSGSGQSPIRTALPPPKQPASRSFEVSLLRHYTPEHRRGSADAMPTIYSGWEKGSTLTKSATSDVSSVPSPTAAVPITNGGLLNTGGVGSPPGVIPSAPVSPPQAHHVNIVRDIIRQYHALRFANRGSSDFILGSSTIGEGGFSDGLPWVYQAAVALAKLL